MVSFKYNFTSHGNRAEISISKKMKPSIQKVAIKPQSRPIFPRLKWAFLLFITSIAIYLLQDKYGKLNPNASDLEMGELAKYLLTTQFDANEIKQVCSLPLIDAVARVFAEVHPDVTVEKLNGFLDHHHKQMVQWYGGRIKKAERAGGVDPELYYDIIAAYIYQEMKLKYERNPAGNPDVFLASSIVRGGSTLNCVSAPQLFMLFASKWGLRPKFVQLNDHCYLKHEDGNRTFNIECTGETGSGVGVPDEKFLQDIPSQPMFDREKLIKCGAWMTGTDEKQTISFLYYARSSYYCTVLQNAKKAGSQATYTRASDNYYRDQSIALYLNPKDVYVAVNLSNGLMKSKNFQGAMVFLDYAEKLGANLSELRQEIADKKMRFEAQVHRPATGYQNSPEHFRIPWINRATTTNKGRP